MDAIDFEHLSVLPRIQIMVRMSQLPFFDLIVEARSQMRGQGAMQRGLGVSPVDLGYSPHKLGIPSTIEPRWERLTRVPPYPTWPVG